MREHHGPGEVEVDRETTLVARLLADADAHPSREAVAVRDGDGFASWELGELARQIRSTARGLIGLGVQPGQSVAIMSSTRVEWTIIDYAIWAIGAVTVPIHETFTAERAASIIDDSAAVATLFGSQEQADGFRAEADRPSGCDHVFVLDADGLAQLQALGDGIDNDAVSDRLGGLRMEQTATIVYTSGTTGRPKGCVWTHGNLAWTVAQSIATIDEVIEEGRTTLLFLPLAHAFARLIQVVALDTGVVIAYSAGPDELADELVRFRPDFFLAVPRVFEKLFARAESEAHAGGALGSRVFDRAVAVAEAWSREDATGSVRLPTRLQHAVFERLIYRRIRAVLGGRVTHAIVGGDAFDERLAHVFIGIGITILEGYGQTETTGPAALNRLSARRIGTVGPPLPGVTIRIADDGEILVRGENVFQGYHGKEEQTREVLSADGWLATGDLGELDEGFLRYVGRKKEMIVTSTGENVVPTELEDQLRAHPLISHPLAVGDGRPFVGMLLSLDHDELATWANERGRSPDDLQQLIQDEELRAELDSAIDAVNQTVSRPVERIGDFRILPRELRIDEGELTPTNKVKRKAVEDRYRDLIEDLYRDT